MVRYLTEHDVKLLALEDVVLVDSYCSQLWMVSCGEPGYPNWMWSICLWGIPGVDPGPTDPHRNAAKLLLWVLTFQAPLCSVLLESLPFWCQKVREVELVRFGVSHGRFRRCLAIWPKSAQNGFCWKRGGALVLLVLLVRMVLRLLLVLLVGLGPFLLAAPLCSVLILDLHK